MTTPTGRIQASDVNAELGRAWNQRFEFNDAAVRNLAGRPSGYVDMWNLRGKSSYVPMSLTGHGDYSSGQIYGNTSTTGSCYPTVGIGGGAGPFTYAWRIVSGGQSISGANTANPRVYASFKYSYSADAELEVTVTDSTGRTATIRGIWCTWEWYQEGQDPR